MKFQYPFASGKKHGTPTRKSSLEKMSLTSVHIRDDGCYSLKERKDHQDQTPPDAADPSSISMILEESESSIHRSSAWVFHSCSTAIVILLSFHQIWERATNSRRGLR